MSTASSSRRPMPAAVLLVVLLVLAILSAGTVAAKKMTPEEKKALRDAADAADLSIRHFDHDQVEPTISKGLDFQRALDSRYPTGLPKNYGIAKVECSEDPDFCTQTHGVDGYPTTYLFEDGVRQEEYKFEDETYALLDYLEGKHRQYLHRNSNAGSAHEDVAAAAGAPAAPKAPAVKAADGDAGHKSSPLLPVEYDDEEAEEQTKLKESGLGIGGFVLFCLIGAVAVVSYRAYSKSSGKPKYRGLPTMAQRT
ncbi:hypothetical protein HK101_000247 [Irineochytrium annulatum]|nr:hypothetical protein HK101_000247 [Irineochytrium annulatum]